MDDTAAIALVIGAAAFSACYRMIIKQSQDRIALLCGLNVISTIAGLIAINFVPSINAQAFVYLLISSGFYTASMAFLSIAYSHGEFSQVTPIQSAVQVLGIAFLMVWLYDEPATIAHWFAFGLVVFALLMQSPVTTWRNLQTTKPIAIGMVAGGVSAAQYTADIAGIRAGATPWSYIAWNLLIGAPIAAYGLLTRPKSIVREFGFQRFSILVGSVLDMSSYAAILFVVYYLAMVDILPLLNLNIVFASLIGWVWFKDSLPSRRVGASVVLLCAAVIAESPDLTSVFA